MQNYPSDVGHRLSRYDQSLAWLIEKKGYPGCKEILGSKKLDSTYILSHLRPTESPTNSAENV